MKPIYLVIMHKRKANAQVRKQNEIASFPTLRAIESEKLMYLASILILKRKCEHELCAGSSDTWHSSVYSALWNIGVVTAFSIGYYVL